MPQRTTNMKLFTDEIVRRLQKVLDMDANEIEGLLQAPTDTSMGDCSLPCFKLAKTLRKAPTLIAEELAEGIEPVSYTHLTLPTTPYV